MGDGIERWRPSNSRFVFPGSGVRSGACAIGGPAWRARWRILNTREFRPSNGDDGRPTTRMLARVDAVVVLV
jgi:hypothetical protein